MAGSESARGRLSGRAALVAGASGDIGGAICRRFASEGAAVGIHGFRNTAAAEELRGELVQTGARVSVVTADGRDETQVKAAVQQTADELGGLHILVHCAGITRDALLLRTSADQWADVIETNLTSAFHFARAAAGLMIGQRWGRIIGVSSVAAAVPAPGQASYAASKGGMEAFVRALAVELGPKQITVNAIAPGRVAGRMTSEVNERKGDRLLSRIPLGRYGEPADVAALAAFLASDDGRYITGQIVTVDGGLSLGAKLG